MKYLKGEIKVGSAVRLAKGVKISEAKELMLDALKYKVRDVKVKDVMWETGEVEANLSGNPDKLGELLEWARENCQMIRRMDLISKIEELKDEN